MTYLEALEAVHDAVVEVHRHVDARAMFIMARDVEGVHEAETAASMARVDLDKALAVVAAIKATQQAASN